VVLQVAPNINSLVTSTAPLGTTAGNTTTPFSTSVGSTNNNQILLREERVTNGADWTTTRSRVTTRVDATDITYIDLRTDTTNPAIAFGTGAAGAPVERMRITQGGNVGIGTTGPTQLLTVAGTTNQLSLTTGTNELIARASSTEVALYTFQSVPMSFYTSNAERMRIDASGNVGIGTSAPVSKLNVSSSGFNIVTSSSTGGYAAFQRLAPAGQAAYDFYTINGVEAGRITVDGTNNMAFATGSAATERMRIDGTGNVGIGTGTPEGNLDVTGTTIARGGANGFGLFIPKPGTSPIGANYDRFWVRVEPSDQVTTLGNTHGGTGSPRALAFLAANSERMRIDTAGNVGIGETAPDYKLDVNGAIGFTPGASVTPVDNGDVVFELTNNTTLTIKARGSDGVVRSGTITLA
jgi:hypothetical protein